MKTIQLETEWNDVFEFYRDEKGVKKMDKVNLQNYFYINKANTLDAEAVLNETTTKTGKPVEYEFYNDNKKSIYSEDLVKVVPNNYHFWACRKALKEEKIKTYEGWMDILLKYITENKTSFTDKRRVGLIDIETDMSLDVEHAPAVINAITIYNYEDELYHTWALNNPNKDKITYDNEKVKLYVFDDESKMMIHFAEKFKEFDFDICGGWNSNNYDFAYIINRFKTLKLRPEMLSKFDKIDIRSYYDSKKGRTSWYPKIWGVELIDFIPVLAKNTCYAPQPANWKLSSCADFYLEIDKLTDIGAQAWKTDVNNFIKYNIRDVELVKELVDKFALIDFLLVIQNDLAGINLNSATHNSMVLLYYLKTHYPNVILPDNPGYLYLEDDLVNLKQTYLKIKAAHVIPPTSGIHHNVSIFDFAGLYPSIFRTFNICPSTLNETEGAEIDDIIMWNMIKEGKATSTIIKEYNFACKFKQDKKGIYPEVLEDLTAKRKIHKSKLKELKAQYGDKSREYLLALYRSDVLKQVSNSLFGVGAFNSFCIFNPKVSAAVTSVSRKALKLVEQLSINKGYNVITGDSVTANTTLFIKYKDRNYFYTINELVNKFKNHKTDRKDKDEYVFDEEVLTWSYNFDTKKSEIKPIKKLIIHDVGVKRLYNVSSKYYSFNVTEDHGFYNNDSKLMTVKEYKKSERMHNVVNPPKQIALNNLKFTNKIKSINLLELSKVPLKYYLERNRKYNLEIKENYFELSNTYLHGSKKGEVYNIKKFPIKLELNSKLGFVVGAYIAEGSVCRNGTSGFRIAANDKKYIKEVYNYLKELFGNMIGLKDNNTRIVGGNYILSNLFKELGGMKCKHKKLPDFILDTNEEFYLGFLRGYTLGDGFHEHRFEKDVDHLIIGGVGSKSKKLVSQIYFIMKNVYNYSDACLRIRYRVDKDFYSCSWDLNVKQQSGCVLQTKNILTNYDKVYDIEVEDNHNFIDIQGGIILHNTDSVMVTHPIDIDAEELGQKLNDELKVWINEHYPNLNKDNYCMNLEYEKTLKTFVMKDAKKKYYGLLADGSFYCKGFDIIQHSLSKKVKEMIKEVYLLLMNNPGDVAMAKDKIKEIKKVFYNLKPNELGNELKIAKNLVDYDSDIQHIRAAKYSNQYLGTNFDAGDAGKLVYLIPKSNNTFPATDVIFLDGDMKLPEGFIVDYDKHWKKFFIDKIKLLDDITIMKIDRILSPNASLDMFL